MWATLLMTADYFSFMHAHFLHTSHRGTSFPSGAAFLHFSTEEKNQDINLQAGGAGPGEVRDGVVLR